MTDTFLWMTKKVSQKMVTISGSVGHSFPPKTDYKAGSERQINFSINLDTYLFYTINLENEQIVHSCGN